MAVLEVRLDATDGCTAEGVDNAATMLASLAPALLARLQPRTAAGGILGGGGGGGGGGDAHSQQEIAHRLWVAVHRVHAGDALACRGRTQRHDFVTSSVVLLYMVYPVLVKRLFSLVSCRTLTGKQHGQLFLRFDLDLRCYDAAHGGWLLRLFLPGCLLYVIGLPLAAFLVLFNSRRHLKSTDTALKYGFLYSGYRHECYYWELTVVLRKAVMVLISLFLAQYGTELQTYVAIGFLGACLYTHMVARPYVDPVLFRLEKQALMAALGTLWLGLLLFSASLPVSSHWVITALIFALNIAFMLRCLHLMAVEYFTEARQAVHTAYSRRRERRKAAGASKGSRMGSAAAAKKIHVAPAATVVQCAPPVVAKSAEGAAESRLPASPAPPLEAAHQRSGPRRSILATAAAAVTRNTSPTSRHRTTHRASKDHNSAGKPKRKHHRQHSTSGSGSSAQKHRHHSRKLSTRSKRTKSKH